MVLRPLGVMSCEHRREWRLVQSAKSSCAFVRHRVDLFYASSSRCPLASRRNMALLPVRVSSLLRALVLSAYRAAARAKCDNALRRTQGDE